MERFTLTEQHIKLLENAYVDWNDGETGAPAIDCKRPYGHSFVPGDIAKILEIDLGDQEADVDAYEDNCRKLLELHRETQTALQIILSCQTFGPGEFECKKYGSWERVG